MEYESRKYCTIGLFKYEADPMSERFGQPLPGPPHAIYLDPQAEEEEGGGLAVLNRGRVLRPSDDSRGWRWRERLLDKRDGSLLFGGEGEVAHVEER